MKKNYLLLILFNIFMILCSQLALSSLSQAYNDSYIVATFDGSFDSIKDYKYNFSVPVSYSDPDFSTSTPLIGNNSLYFHYNDGTQGDKIQASINDSGTVNNYTFDFWMRHNGSSANQYLITFTPPGATAGFNCNVNNQQISCRADGGGACPTALSDVSDDFQINHIVISLNVLQDRFVFWHNDNLVSNISCPSNDPLSTWTSLGIGDYFTTAGGKVNNFEGVFDNFVMTSYVYTSADVTDSYNSGNGFDWSTLEPVPPPPPPTEDMYIVPFFMDSLGNYIYSINEGEYFNFVANVTSSLNSSYLNSSECYYSVDSSERFYDMYYNYTLDLFVSENSYVYYDKSEHEFDIYCNERLREQNLLFYDYMEDETDGIDYTKWADNNGNYDGNSESVIVKRGQYSFNISGESVQKTNFGVTAIGNYSLEFYIYKPNGTRTQFESNGGVIGWYWNQSNHVLPQGWGGLPEIFYLSPDTWHKVFINQTDNFTHSLYIDDVFIHNATDSPNQLPFDIILGKDTVNYYTAYYDYLRVAQHDEWHLYSNSSTLNISILNIAPVVDIFSLNNSNSTISLTNNTIHEYSSGLYIFTYNVTDDDIDTINVSIFNSTSMMYSKTGNTIFSVNLTDSYFLDDEANPFYMYLWANDTDGDSDYEIAYFNISDNIFPYCDGLVNATINVSHNYTWSISCYDESFFSFNISCTNNYTYFEDNILSTSYNFNEQMNITSNTSCFARYCDGHTKNKLSDDITISKPNQISIKVKKGKYENIFYAVGGGSPAVSYIKQTDRFKIIVDYEPSESNKKKKLNNKKLYSFRYIASPNSYYVPSDEYSCWIIDKDAETWFDCNLDFYDPEFETYVEPLGNGVYDITLYSQYSYLSFESIGELNCYNSSQFIESYPLPPIIVPPSNETSTVLGGNVTINFGEGYGSRVSDFNFPEIIMIGFILMLLMFMMAVGLYTKVPAVVFLTGIIFLFLGLFIQWMGLPRWISLIGVGMISWSLIMMFVSLGLARK